MVRRACTFLVVAAVLAAASVARADLSRRGEYASPSALSDARPASLVVGVSPAAAIVQDGCASQSECVDYSFGGVYSSPDLLYNPYAVNRIEETDAGSEAAASSIHELPPAPGGATLLLSGLLSLGAIQLTRSARHVHLGVLPAWYHDACPDRIGHTVAFDFDMADMPVCFVADIAVTDVTANPPAFHKYLRESRSRIESQFVLPVIAPRGPPVIA